MRTKLALVVALVLVVAACGGGEFDTAAFETTNAAPTTSAAPDTTMAADEHMDDTMAHDDMSDDTMAHDEMSDDSMAHDDSTAAENTTPADRTVEIAMTEFAFEPASLTVVAGETIEFVVTNDGVVPHEFRLSNAHRIEEHIASGHEDHGDEGEGGHHEGDADVVIEVEAGATDTVTVTLPEDATIFTEIACLLPGHYEAGMKGEVTYSS